MSTVRHIVQKVEAIVSGINTIQPADSHILQVVAKLANHCNVHILLELYV